MLQANTTYTAFDVLEEVKNDLVEYGDVSSIFGNYRVIIGGISGIVAPGHLIRFQRGSTEVEVIVGVKRFTLPLQQVAEHMASEFAQSVLEQEGQLATAQAEELQRAKAELKEQQ